MMLMVCSLACSCDREDPDGLWTPMKWEKTNYERAQQEGGHKPYVVPAEGASFTFSCTNYSGIWIGGIDEVVYDGTVSNLFRYEDFHSFANDDLEVKVDGSRFTVTFPPTEQQGQRFVVTMTAGDIFSSFVFQR